MRALRADPQGADGRMGRAGCDAHRWLAAAGRRKRRAAAAGWPAGPAFLVTRNFDAIYSYNAAESYALAIALLSDRLRGRHGLLTAWPTNDPGLSRADRREMQTLLMRRGYDLDGKADGVIGTKTKQAISDFQSKVRLACGWPRLGLGARRAARTLTCQSYQNVSRETFWYDWGKKLLKSLICPSACGTCDRAEITTDRTL